MSTVAPVGSWSSTVSLTAGARFRYTATPGAGGSVRMQWTDGSLWFDFGNSNISAVTTSVIPAAATGIRGQGIGAAGSFDTASDDPLAPNFRGTVADATAMLALTGVVIGQSVKRTDTSTIWTLTAQPASTLGNWTECSGTGSETAGLAFGSDPTAVGANGTPYTVTGLPWVVAYNGDGSVASYTIDLAGTTDLVRTVSYTGGFPTYSGNIEIDGATVMTLTQLQYLYSEILVSLGTAARGARFRVQGSVDADFLAYTVNAGGTRRNKACVLEWDGARLVAVSGVSLETWETTTFTNSASESPALSTIVLPKWLNKAGCRWNVYHVQTATGGSANTVRGVIKVNTNVITNPNSSSASDVTQSLEIDINCVSDAAQFFMPSALAATGRTGATGVAYTTLAIDSSSTDITVTTHTQMGALDASRTVTHRLTRAEMVS